MIRIRMTKETWRGSSCFGSSAASSRRTGGLIADSINVYCCQLQTTGRLAGIHVDVGGRHAVRMPAGA
jgi:hypothetical protein